MFKNQNEPSKINMAAIALRIFPWAYVRVGLLAGLQVTWHTGHDAQARLEL